MKYIKTYNNLFESLKDELIIGHVYYKNDNHAVIIYIGPSDRFDYPFICYSIYQKRNQRFSDYYKLDNYNDIGSLEDYINHYPIIKDQIIKDFSDDDFILKDKFLPTSTKNNIIEFRDKYLKKHINLNQLGIL